MSHPRIHPVTDIIAAISVSASLTSWQTQLDWSLRIIGAIVAIAAGVITIYQRLKKKTRVKAE